MLVLANAPCLAQTKDNSAEKNIAAPQSEQVQALHNDVDAIAFLEFLADMQKVDKEWVSAMDMAEDSRVEQTQKSAKPEKVTKEGGNHD